MQNNHSLVDCHSDRLQADAEYHRGLVRDYWLSTVQARLPLFGNMLHSTSIVDDHLHGLEHALSYAKHVRNLSLPAMRLPVELLSMVFSYLSDEWSPMRVMSTTVEAIGKEPQTHFVYQLNWISAALHVCHLWRNHLLQIPSLWSFVDATAMPPCLAPWFIHLSQNTSLHLCLELSRPDEKVNTFEILRSVLVPPQISRLFALSLELCDTSIVPALISAVLPAQMPALTYLNISLAPDLIPKKKDIIYLPVAWLARCFPNLQDLHLMQCALTWPTSGNVVALPNLKIFKYIIDDADRYVSPKSTLTMDQMSVFWTSMPRLESVQMRSPAPFVQTPQTPSNAHLYTMRSEPILTLSSTLKSFSLGSPCASISPLASIVRVPSSAQTELNTSSLADFSALPLRQFCGAHHPPQTLLFSLGLENKNSYSYLEWEALILAWDKSPGMAGWTDTSATEPSLSVHGEWTGRNGQTTNPLSEMDLSELRLLVLAGENDMKVCDLGSSEAFYHRAPKLQRLEVADWKVAVNFFRTLVPKAVGNCTPLFPELEEICVGIVSEVSEQGHEQDEPLKIPNSEQVLRIVSCMAARSARGCPLGRIILPSSLEHSGEWLDRIEETGVQVEFI